MLLLLIKLAQRIALGQQPFQQFAVAAGLRLQCAQQLLGVLLRRVRIGGGEPVAEQAFRQFALQLFTLFDQARLFVGRARLCSQVVHHPAAVLFIQRQQRGPAVAGLADLTLDGVVGPRFAFLTQVERCDRPD